jgi:mono/diheme cytochrome c family protein
MDPRIIFSILVAAVMFGSTAYGQSPGLSPADDPARGRIIANTWCSSCHLVEADESRTVLADVPTFTAIARRLPSDAEVLAAFIIDPHPPMPDLGLSRKDIRDVLAYIATLK